ncbi:helix-turn-helix transcriptional regulator [Stenotrophomonas indicatrix]|uniref:helix-turn-helix transcriptional regulator n=1 Tax=Stenotrophomonas indicatrix TaxID=2045451 RepID=UPI000FD9D823|nr:helix-turn-helix transcriptional regulator [Stenotrophomonas indicatrix]
MTVTNIVHQPLPAAIGHTPSPLPDFSDTARWAQVLVQDNLNAPRFQQGDVLHVDLGRNRFMGDSHYVVEIGGQQMIRIVQARPGGLWIFPVGHPSTAYPVARELLTVLGEVMYATTTRRVG